MKRTTFIILLLVALTGITSETFAQRAIGGRRLVLDDNSGNVITLDNYNRGILIGATGPTGIDPFSSSMLTVDGLGTGGVAPALTSPRGVLFAPMSTAQRNLIVNPANGLLVYNTTTNTYDVFAGGAWGAISGWTMVGNNIAAGGGGTALGQNFLGSLNNADVVIATNVGVAGSGLGERVRITGAGQVGISAMNSPFAPLMDVHIDGTNGTANVRLNSLGGAPLLVPALNLAADGITIAGGMGDLLKYDVATVVGSVAWLRTGNDIVDGNNLFGTIAASATPDVQMVTNGLPVMYLDGTTQFVGVGNSTPAYTLDVTGTLGSSGSSDIGTDPLTNNTFGNNSAGTNQIGDGAQFNYIGDNATNFNSFGYGAVLNDFGGSVAANQSNTYGQNDGAFSINNYMGNHNGGTFTTNDIGSALVGGFVVNNIGTNTGGALMTNNIGVLGTTSNNIGSGAASTNMIRGANDINVGINAVTNINTGGGVGATNIGSNNAVTITSSANDVTVNTDAGNTANDLVLTGIDAPASQFDLLTININGDVNAVGRATGTAVTQQGVSFDNEGANGTRIRLGATAAGNAATLYPLLVNRFVNLDNLTLSFNRGAGTDNMLSLNGATDVVTIEGTTNINVSHNTATNINTGTSTSAVAVGNAGVGSGPVSITSGRTVAAGDVTIATVDNAGVGADLVLNGIETESPMTGNVLWLTAGGNEVRKSITSDLAEQGITWKLEGGALRVRLGALDGDPVPTNALLANRNVYLGGFRLNFSDNTGASYLSMNDATNTTQLGVAGAGGTANTVTGTTNTLTATANNVLGAAAQNQLTGGTGNLVSATTGNNTITSVAAQNVITGQTGNSMTATTGNNAIAATAGTNALTAGTSNTMNAPTNTVTATGAGGNDIIATTADNVITGQTGNTITATTGNNTITASAAAGDNVVTAGDGNTIQANGLGGNLITATAAGNTMVAFSGNQIQANGVAGNIITATAAGGFNLITTSAGPNNITSVGGDIALTVPGAASGNDIRMVGVDAGILPIPGTDRMVYLNATHDVRTRSLSGLASEGLFYDAAAGAFKLGDPAATNPITTVGRIVRNSTGSLIFDGGAANNYINMGTAAANTLALGNATNTFSIASNQLNVATTGVISDAGGDVQFADNADMQLNLVLNIGNANTDFTGTGGLNLAGALDGAAAGNELGATTAARQLTVLGVVDATGAENNASPVWDAQVIGDLGASGMIKSGNSILIDGVSATRRILSDAALNISTTAGNMTLTSAGGSINIANPGNVLPSVNLTQELGSAALRWDVFADVVNANSLVLPPMTMGSVLFVGAGGQMTQDNPNFFWDDVNNRLGLGVALPDAQLHVNGQSHFVGTVLMNAQLTISGGGALISGGAVIGGGAIINGGALVNNSLTLSLALPATNQDYVLTTPSNAGGATGIRQFSELPFQGYGRVQMAATAANYNLIVGTDYILICNNAAGAITVNLPAAAGNQGKTFIIKAAGPAAADAVNVTPAGASLIDGAAGAYMMIGGGNLSRTFVCDGTNWFIIGN